MRTLNRHLLILLIIVASGLLILYARTSCVEIIKEEPVVVAESITSPEPSATEEPEVNTRKIESQYINLGTFQLTAYCPCEFCNGQWADGITSTGNTAQAGRTIAVDPTVIPYGSNIKINGHTYVAEDCGGAIKGNRIDIFFNSHEEAMQFGVQYAEVSLYVGGE